MSLAPPPEKLTTTQYAMLYAEAGYTVVPITGKRCTIKGWPNYPYTPPPKIPALIPEGQNFGIVLQDDDLVIDVDPRSFKHGPKGKINSLTKLLSQANASREGIRTIAAIVRTGGGGNHIYFKIPRDFNKAILYELKADFPGIQFLTKGHYVVAAGSLHPDSKTFYHLSPLGRSFKEVGTAPLAILEICSQDKTTKPQPKDEKDPEPVYMDDNNTIVQGYSEYLTIVEAAIEGDGGDRKTYQVALRGRDAALSEAKTLDLMAKHYNPRCMPPWSHEDLAKKVANAYAYGKDDPGNATAQKEFKPVKEPDKGGMKIVRWDRKNGNFVKNTNNTVNWFLMEESELYNTIGFDRFSGRVAVQKDLPWRKHQGVDDEWNDHDSMQLLLFLSRRYSYDISQILADQSVTVYAQTRPFHPLQDYLKKLRWDKTERLETWLIDHGEAKDNQYNRAVSKLMIMQAVNRAMHPGCKADYLVILESAQGRYKSQTLEALGGRWYADINLDVRNKDTIDAMQGKWIIELSEVIETHRRIEHNMMKGFLSRTQDRVRLAYGRRSESLKRSCVFVGTMNPESLNRYFGDTTGNRRYLPVSLRKLDINAIKDIRDQLFAEAMYRFRRLKEKTFIEDPNIIRLCEEEQRKRLIYDPWEDVIEAYLKTNDWPETTTALDIYRWGIKGTEPTLNPASYKRISTSLKALGYIGIISTIDGRNTRVYRNARLNLKPERDGS